MSNKTTIETWMPEARQLAAQCWCDKETEDRVMDVALAEAIAKRIAAWMDTAAQAYRDVEYYRGLLDQIGKALGDKAYIADDGTRSEEVLRAKLPELISKLLADVGYDNCGCGSGKKFDDCCKDKIPPGHFESLVKKP